MAKPLEKAVFDVALEASNDNNRLWLVRNVLDDKGDHRLPSRRVSGRTSTRFHRVDGKWVAIPQEKDDAPRRESTPQERALGRAVAWHKRTVEEENLFIWGAYFAWRQSIGDPGCKDFQPPVRVSENPRHRDLADALRPLLAWRSISRHEYGLTTNWRIIPKNGEHGADEDDEPEDGEPQRHLQRDRLMETRPREEEMIAMYGDGTDIVRYAAKKRKRPSHWTWPAKGTSIPAPAVRIGGLCFSNGNAEESAYVWRGGKLVKGKIVMPAGALMRYGASPDKRGFPTVDRFADLRGSDDDDDRSQSAKDELAASNDFWASLLGTQPHRYIPASRKRRPFMMSRADQLETLATKPKPPVTYCPPGLPCGQKRAADAFLGCTHSPTFNAGSGRNDNPWLEKTLSAAVRASVSDDDAAVLDAALTAGTFQDVGVAMGATGKTAERKGKAALLKATERLGKKIKEYLEIRSRFTELRGM